MNFIVNPLSQARVKRRPDLFFTDWKRASVYKSGRSNCWNFPLLERYFRLWQRLCHTVHDVNAQAQQVLGLFDCVPGFRMGSWISICIADVVKSLQKLFIRLAPCAKVLEHIAPHQLLNSPSLHDLRIVRPERCLRRT